MHERTLLEKEVQRPVQIWLTLFNFGQVDQLEDQLLCKQQASGSNPDLSIRKAKKLYMNTTF